MDDRDVIDAFLNKGTTNCFGPTLHVEGDVLLLNGWWHVALRISPDAFIVRNEEPREESTVLEDIARALGARQLQQVGVDLPLIQAVTYAHLSLGQMSWQLWAADLGAGERALINKVGADSFLNDAPIFPEPSGTFESKDFSAELGGARRVSGLPPTVILAVGLNPEQASQLHASFADCQVETRGFDEIEPGACGTLIPSAVIVDAAEQIGREFIMELRVDACGRFLPVVAVTEDDKPPPGADEVLDPRLDPASWVQPLRALLP
ncbi:MAG: hypothetical protein KY454_01020 [Actinobacteria bacterium]|nr:hypothetical protein [Actinomycetota bacterium]